MHQVMIAGAGVIGKLIASLLMSTQDYQIHWVDLRKESINLKINGQDVMLESRILDVTNSSELADFLKKHHITTLISSLPYFNTLTCANTCQQMGIHYFDLTEDVHVRKSVQSLATGKKSIFMPQCGLAPGVVSLIASFLMKKFDMVHDVSLRVGALPLNCDNALKYGFTWSLDGLINQYCNPCQALENDELITLKPLEDLAELTIDGVCYEIFNTSGGLGTLAESYQGKVKKMNYKSMRYPGHCEKMRFLLNGLKLHEDRATLKEILKRSIPSMHRDVVIVYVSVNGLQDGIFLEKNYVTKIYSKEFFGRTWTAIQLATASSICAMVDLVLPEQENHHGFVKQEEMDFELFLKNRFGCVYANDNQSKDYAWTS